MQVKNTLLFIFLFSSCFKVWGQKNLIRKSIYFEKAQYKLSEEGKGKLDAMIDTLKKFESYKIYLRGFTDNSGDSISNIILSGKRVNAAKEYLLGKGISAIFITATAMGQDKPMADNNTEEGKRMNRRVDMAVVFKR
jgi:OOP family OmpA-OmpF porin